MSAQAVVGAISQRQRGVESAGSPTLWRVVA
jgi:hypothetical protein